MASVEQNFVDWFRQSSPYIHAHRGRVMVLSFDGEALADGNFANLIHDITLLNGLGIKLLLVPGARPQIEARLKARKVAMQVVNGLRVTDAQALECVKEAAGAVRIEIEALLSMGLANSPMAGTCIRVASGNLVTAKPLGIIDGTDYQHTGKVRRIDAQALHAMLAQGSIALVPPIGYSPTGEVFNLHAADVASAVARALDADKLVYLTESKVGGRGKAINSLIPTEVDALLARRKSLPEEHRRVLSNAASACRAGVTRTHILNRKVDGVLLSELFTRDGAGILITEEPYEQMRMASIDDVGGILELISPLENAGALVKRSREKLEQEIEQFVLIERDGSVIACAALYPFAKEKLGELACLAVHPDYRGNQRGDRLLEKIESLAREQNLNHLFVLSTLTSHWFRERGFVQTKLEKLPKRKRDLYNWQRNSRAFLKPLS